MKHFEPIVIQEESEIRLEMSISPAKRLGLYDENDSIDIVLSGSGKEVDRWGLTHAAATRLRDALNTILND